MKPATSKAKREQESQPVSVRLNPSLLREMQERARSQERDLSFFLRKSIEIGWTILKERAA